MSELIITNGDSAVGLMQAAGFKADILPWRDVLHEGPVPAKTEPHADDLQQLSETRAAFLADAFSQPMEMITKEFDARDQMICAHEDYDEVTLWFEHDLYDQLQLLQILDFFYQAKRSHDLQWVQADDYLGRQTPDGIKHLQEKKAPVSEVQLALATAIFQAFRKPEPSDLAAFLTEDLRALPYMRQALQRLFEELPSTANGLSRTQSQALSLIQRGDQMPQTLFGAVQAMEEAMFMGDVSFFRCLEELAFNKSPLITGFPATFDASASQDERQRYLNTTITLSDVGEAVLSGKADHAAVNLIDRWLGGTHVTGDAIWRWNADTASLIAPTRR